MRDAVTNLSAFAMIERVSVAKKSERMRASFSLSSEGKHVGDLIMSPSFHGF